MKFDDFLNNLIFSGTKSRLNNQLITSLQIIILKKIYNEIKSAVTDNRKTKTRNVDKIRRGDANAGFGIKPPGGGGGVVLVRVEQW